MTVLWRQAETEKLSEAPLGAAQQQYGVVPWRIGKRGQVEVMLIATRHSERWTVPMGWPTEGKTPTQIATQEAFEAAGVVGGVDPHPVGEYRCVGSLPDGSRIDYVVTLFGLQVCGTLVRWPERAERERRWHCRPEASEVASDGQLRQLLATFRQANEQPCDIREHGRPASLS